MTQVCRPFSVAYQQETGRPVTHMMNGPPYSEYVDAAYVAWLEERLILVLPREKA